MSFTNKSYTTSIRFKVMVYLGLTLLVFFLGYLIFFSILDKKNNQTLKFQEQELTGSLNTILEIHSDTYRKMVYDYSVFSWMIDFINNPQNYQPDLTISHPQNLGLTFIEVFNLKKKIVYADFTPQWKDTVAVSPAFFDSLLINRKYSFFIRTSKGILQLFASTVHPSLDINQKTSPKGFVVFGKVWNDKYISDLQKAISGKILLQGKNDVTQVDGQVLFPLKDYGGETVAFMEISKKFPFMENIQKMNIYLKVIYIAFCLILFIISYFTYKSLVVSPLVKIKASLSQESDKPIRTLARSKNEFGQVANLISKFFKQRQELQQKVQELNQAQKTLRTLNDELLTQKREMEKQYQQLNFLNDEMQSQNEEIVSIAEGLQVANKEITDSISYASVVQHAVLASTSELSDIFPEHFIFYKPRNIVSGDFYWFKQMSNGDRIMAVADCTGHGLSGSLLSMLGISYLNQIVAQYQNHYSAAMILGKLKEFFIQSLHQMDAMENIQDGMHIALFILDKNNRRMQYATAFHSINLVREGQILEFKGNRIPVGIYITDEEFENYEMEIRKGDLIYMFSDGITDQFGGLSNKKYMTAKFRQFLLSISHLPMDIQKQRIIHEFETWKGHHDQTDDVIVMGVRIS